MNGRPLRVALVTEYYYPHLGGVCEHVHHFAREARARGHHVDVVTSRIAGAGPMPNVIRIGHSIPWYINGSQSRLTVGSALRRTMRSVLRDGGYDIVHVHSPLTPVLPLLAVEEADAPVVGTFHTYFDWSVGYQVLRGYFQRRLEMLSAAIAVSPSTVSALSRYFRGTWRVIPNGVDTHHFRRGVAAPDTILPGLPAILFLGRFDPRNGLAVLIEAFRRVRATGRDAQLVVVGDGPLREHYRRLARGHPEIRFAGPVLEERPAYYANCQVYACPTTKASFGITLLEAMACHTPIVCSDIPGFRDVVQDGREALLVPSADAAALADRLSMLLDDDALRWRLGATGRERAITYDWRRVSSEVLDVYHQVLGTAPVAMAV